MKQEQVTLPEVLEFREQKAFIQTGYLREKNGCVVVSLGMNIPGPVKTGPSILAAFQEGKRSLEAVIRQQGGHVEAITVLEKKAGNAAVYQVSGADSLVLKRAAVALEETHELGRIFDVDVLDAAGCALTREAVGAARRKCLICGEDAKVCGRNRTHTVEQLQECVFGLIDRWKAGA